MLVVFVPFEFELTQLVVNCTVLRRLLRLVIWSSEKVWVIVPDVITVVGKVGNIHRPPGIVVLVDDEFPIVIVGRPG